MSLEATDHATKGLLIEAIGPIGIMAPLAFLRGIGAHDSGCLYASFGGVPFDLLGDVGEVRRAQIGIHRACFVLHRGNGEVFIGKLGAFMLRKALIDCPVDLLLDMPDQALPALIARRGEFLNAFLFQALAEFRLPAALLPISLLSLAQLAMEGPVVPTRCATSC